MTSNRGAAWTRMCFADDVKKAVVASAGLKARFGTLASHCYNQSKPDQTVWWLFPKAKSTFANWPAYHLGKYFFDRVSARKVVRVGLHIEKGLALENAVGYGSAKAKHFGMTDSWAWHSFLNDLESGRLGEAVDQVLTRAGTALEVVIEPGFALDELENHVHEVPGYHRYEVSSGSRLRLLEERPQPKKLAGVGEASSFSSLGARLRRATYEEPWTWINVFVASAIPFHAESHPDDGPDWIGGDFWERVLEPLADWVK